MPALAELIQRSKVPGCAVGILHRDQSAEFVFQGECTLGGDAITRDSLWEAASLTTPVVALLSLLYVLNDPTFLNQRLVSDLHAIGADDDDRWMEVTPFHLLTHTSGLPNWRDDGHPLGFESDPGTAGYSGEGYELLLCELIARPGQAVHGELKAAANLAAERKTEVLPGFGRTLGWAFVAGEDGDVLWQHGDNPGFKHVAAVRPTTGEAIGVFTNGDDGRHLYRELCLGFLDVEVW